jgi:hypothetical protein
VLSSLSYEDQLARNRKYHVFVLGWALWLSESMLLRLELRWISLVVYTKLVNSNSDILVAMLRSVGPGVRRVNYSYISVFMLL